MLYREAISITKGDGQASATDAWVRACGTDPIARIAALNYFLELHFEPMPHEDLVKLVMAIERHLRGAPGQAGRPLEHLAGLDRALAGFLETTRAVEFDRQGLSTVLEAFAINHIVLQDQERTLGDVAAEPDEDEIGNLLTALREYLSRHPEAAFASPRGFTWCAVTDEIDRILDAAGPAAASEVRDHLGLRYEDSFLVEFRYSHDPAQVCRTPSAAVHALLNELFLPFHRPDRWGMTLHRTDLAPSCRESVRMAAPWPSYSERQLGRAGDLAPGDPERRLKARIVAFEEWLDSLSVAGDRRIRHVDLEEFLGRWA